MTATPSSVEAPSTPTAAMSSPNKENWGASVAQPQPLASATPLRKYTLLAFFCLGQFLDQLNTSAVLPALPAITHNVNLSESDAVWLLAAYQATFASFLLISGRVSDIYSPKHTFIAGTAFFGAISLGAGFINDRIVLIVFRALQGIGAAFTIPSSLSLIVQMFNEPAEQARAIGLFAATGAVGNVLGTIFGAVFAEYASWKWIFWLIAMIALPITVASVWLIPTTPHREDIKLSQLDFVGVSALTAAIILFVYALTTGSLSPWTSAGVLAPLFVSIALAVAFFVWETRVDEKNASLPPKLWFYPNFAVLFAVALVPFFWLTQVYLTFSPYWQDVLHQSSIITGVKFLPLGIVGGIVTFNGGRITKLGHHKLFILGGLGLMLVAALMLPFSARPRDQYWPLVFPAFVIGIAGNAIVFVLTNIAFFRTTPVEYAGTVGAVFNSALQLGPAVGTAATTSIQASVDRRNESEPGFAGRSAALWFLVAFLALEIIAVAVFYREERSVNDLEAKTLEGEQVDVKETIALAV